MATSKMEVDKMATSKMEVDENQAMANVNEDPCIICKMSDVDDILYGPIMSQNGIRCHYFCLLFCPGLYSNGCDVKDMAGFRVVDIKRTVTNIKKSENTCFYCQLPHAAAICCYKGESKGNRCCDRRFHVPCAMKKHALFKFFGEFESYCDEHGKLMIKRTEKVPKMGQICDVCYEPITDLHPVNCFQPPCCVDKVKEKEKGKSYWIHYRCAMMGARNLGYHFNCFAFCCAKTDDDTKQGYLDHGLFIPQRDALYESGDNYKDIDSSPKKNHKTEYDEDATLFKKTFHEEVVGIDCDYGDRCIGSKLGMRDTFKCLIDGCMSFVHVKCIRCYRYIPSNKDARAEKFFCKNCVRNSCLSLI